MSDILLDKYMNKLKNLFQLVENDEFWLTCNQEDNEYLFYLAPCLEQFAWGVITLDDIQNLENLLQTNILYLIPQPPAFQSPLINYQLLTEERYLWTTEFIRIINSWIIASLFYDFSDYLSGETLTETLFFLNKECEKLKIKWLGNKKFFSYFNEREKKLSISQIIDNYLTRKKHSLAAVESLYFWLEI